MNTLEELRQEINHLDEILAKNLKLRLEAAKKIGAYKKQHSLEVVDKKREEMVIQNFISIAGSASKGVIEEIIKLSKAQEY